VREVANAGFGQEGVLRFWFGESDQPTPPYICEAAKEALDAGRTFYTHNQGNADLRKAIDKFEKRWLKERKKTHAQRLSSARKKAQAKVAALKKKASAKKKPASRARKAATAAAA
jgi:bifunctional pyridoxal-dependent enzyme with beta-cystathionase and maltose regulon repressor activities